MLSCAGCKIGIVSLLFALAMAPFLLLLSCPNYPNPDYVSSFGIRFYYHTTPWREEDINKQEQWFVEQISKDRRYPMDKVKKALIGVEVYVFDEPVKNQYSPTGMSNGTQNLWFIYLRDLGNPCKSAFSHELLHFLQFKLYNNVDYEHSEIELWKIADGHYPDCSV